MLIHVTRCMHCGANDTPVQGAMLSYHGGMLVGWFCASCVEGIESEERARQEAQMQNAVTALCTAPDANKG